MPTGVYTYLLHRNTNQIPHTNNTIYIQYLLLKSIKNVKKQLAICNFFLLVVQKETCTYNNRTFSSLYQHYLIQI